MRLAPLLYFLLEHLLTGKIVRERLLSIVSEQPAFWVRWSIVWSLELPEYSDFHSAFKRFLVYCFSGYNLIVVEAMEGVWL